MITSGEFLAENGFRFLEIVTQDGCVAVNDALGPGDLDRAGITFRQRRNIGDQLRFV